MPIKNKKWKNILMLLCGFTVIILLFEILPRALNTLSLTSEWIEQSDQIEMLGKIDARINMITKQNAELKASIGSIVSDYEDNQKISSVLSLFDEIAPNRNVNIEIVKPLEIIKRDNLWLQPIDMTITAMYENFYNFIRFLENSQKVVLVKEITLKNENSVNGKIKINTTFEVYLNL